MVRRPGGAITGVVSEPDRERVLALLKRFGWNSMSFQILEPGFSYWFDGDDACIGYVDTGRAWVIAGSPIAPRERLAEACARFVAAANDAGRRACCFGAETRFLDAVGWPALRIGDQPSWTPAKWDAGVRASRNLREQVRRARAKGVVVRALEIDELAPDHRSR
jgi:phosphatidylglycerol lysyltransferase